MLFLYRAQEHGSTLPSVGLELHFFDVGQGDAALIICNGETMLVDTGPADSADILIHALQAIGVQKLDYLVCTHDHSDHNGGLSAVQATFPVETLITQDTFDEPFFLGNTRVTEFHPLQGSEDENEASLILHLGCGTFSALLMADAGLTAENALLEEYAFLPLTILKVGHHGSKSATGEAFLAGIQPEYAVISVGIHNGFGHPHKEVLERLGTMRTTVLRTDLQGDITFRYDGETLTVETAGDASADTLVLP